MVASLPILIENRNGISRDLLQIFITDTIFIGHFLLVFRISIWLEEKAFRKSPSYRFLNPVS